MSNTFYGQYTVGESLTNQDSYIYYRISNNAVNYYNQYPETFPVSFTLTYNMLTTEYISVKKLKGGETTIIPVLKSKLTDINPTAVPAYFPTTTVTPNTLKYIYYNDYTGNVGSIKPYLGYNSGIKCLYITDNTYVDLWFDDICFGTLAPTVGPTSAPSNTPKPLKTLYLNIVTQIPELNGDKFVIGADPSVDVVLTLSSRFNNINITGLGINTYSRNISLRDTVGLDAEHHRVSYYIINKTDTPVIGIQLIDIDYNDLYVTDKFNLIADKPITSYKGISYNINNFATLAPYTNNKLTYIRHMLIINPFINDYNTLYLEKA